MSYAWPRSLPCIWLANNTLEYPFLCGKVFLIHFVNYLTFFFTFYSSFWLPATAPTTFVQSVLMNPFVSQILFFPHKECQQNISRDILYNGPMFFDNDFLQIFFLSFQQFEILYHSSIFFTPCLQGCQPSLLTQEDRRSSFQWTCYSQLQK